MDKKNENFLREIEELDNQMKKLATGDEDEATGSFHVADQLMVDTLDSGKEASLEVGGAVALADPTLQAGPWASFEVSDYKKHKALVSHFKKQGNKAYRAGKYRIALDFYSKVFSVKQKGRQERSYCPKGAKLRVLAKCLKKRKESRKLNKGKCVDYVLGGKFWKIDIQALLN